MYHFDYVLDEKTGEQWLETSLSGKLLLNTTLLNKGTAFSNQERETFELQGKLPLRVESLEQQIERAYRQYKRYQTDLSRNVYLNNLRDRNETLFYCLLSQHISEMMPMIYTPIVGDAVKAFSQEFRQPRGLYLTYSDQTSMDEMLTNRTHQSIDLIVVTDGGGVLGIGDQGIGAMDIPIAKLMVYTLFAGIHPSRTLPIMLDVGTDNEELLNDPLYLGWRHRRVRGEQYDEFVTHFVESVQKSFPNALLHWEDLGHTEAWRVLKQYQTSSCSFNDDIQGTGVATIAALLAAMQAQKTSWREQRIVVFGAGSAGMGVVQQIVQAMQREGMSEQEAKAAIWLLDRPGLLTDEMTTVTAEQAGFLRPLTETAAWQRNTQGELDLLEVVTQVKPSILIGSSAVTGAFSETVVKEMAQHQKRPIIFPLSNPTERAEAHPKDLLEWTRGEAIVATGSPFMGIAFNGNQYDIAQCNNALAFPGIGLGILAAKANRCSDTMLAAASEALCQMAPIHDDPYGNCLPSLANAYEVSYQVAVKIAEQAKKEGLAKVDDSLTMAERVKNSRWKPGYLPLKKME